MDKSSVKTGYVTPDCIAGSSVEETMLCASFGASEITEVPGAFEWE